jgi:hypothetical protein
MNERAAQAGSELRSTEDVEDAMVTRRSAWWAVLGLAVAAAGVAALAIPLRAQDASREKPAREPALGFLGIAGGKASTLSFLRGLEGGEAGKEPGGRRLTLFLPDLDQLYLYGNKEGVVAFTKGLPEGSVVRVLVRDADRLKSFGDRASTLTFLEALASRRGVMEVWITDVPGLARVGQNAGVLRFVEGLPRNSSVHLFTSARELSLHGDTAGIQSFLATLKCRVEVRLDDPLLDLYLGK